ncbi:MAG: hydroxymethylbilane synthase [Lachnospiraceae bacterium]|nr:hydroxymethylbilane synthase [Lachnospiraceae bacterium]
MSDKRKIVVGSRDSLLAVTQSNLVVDYIRDNCPDIDVSLLTMKTTGDIELNGPLYNMGGKGLFVKELDIALMDRRSDLSVHSLKDLPMEVPEDLPIVGFSKREDPRDVLVLPKGVNEYDGKLPIGCSSLRRILQLETIFPGAEVKNIRGNLQTRLRKLDEGEFGAIILAAAGLKRLGLEDRISRYFDTEELLPACGQGILCLQGRKGEDYSFISGFLDEDATAQALAERAYVKGVDGGCSSPIAAHAKVSGDSLELTALYYNEDTKKYSKKVMTGAKSEAESIGRNMAEFFLKK